LGIASLDAIEWTPQSGIETGGHSRWYVLYRQILDAGKSVQVVSVGIDEIGPLLEAVGGKGVHTMTEVSDDKDARQIEDVVSRYR